MVCERTKLIAFLLVVLLIQIEVPPIYACISEWPPLENPYVATLNGSFDVQGRGTYKVVVYYPEYGSGKPYPAVVFAHGFGSCSSWHKWIGRLLARNGYVMLSFTVPNRVSTEVQQWVDGFEGGITYLQELNKDSPQLSGMIDMSRLGVMGHSMGGMAAIVAASRNPKIKAAVILAAPYMKDKQFDDEYAEKLRLEIDWDGVLTASRSINVPIQFQVGTRDAFASDNAGKYYEAVNSSLKEFVTIEGGNHVQYLDDEAVWSSLSGLIPLMISILRSLTLRQIIEIILSLLFGEEGISILRLMFAELSDVAFIFGLDQSASISLSEQHEVSSQKFLAFLNLYLRMEASPFEG